MSRANIPRANAHAMDWMTMFAQHLVAKPETYHVSPEAAAEVEAAVAEFAALHHQATNRSERTPTLTRARRRARARAESLCRYYYSQIKLNRDISDADKHRAGVRPKKTTRTRSQRPQTPPDLQFNSRATQGYHYLRCNDLASHARTAKPAGVAMVQLFVAYGPEPVRDPKQARLLNVYTTTRIKLPLRRKHDGLVATYFARWASPTGKAGPFSQPQSLRVAA